MHLKPFKLNQQQQVSLVEKIDHHEKMSSWNAETEEVRQIRENFPLVYSLQHDTQHVNDIYNRKPCAYFEDECADCVFDACTESLDCQR